MVCIVKAISQLIFVSSLLLPISGLTQKTDTLIKKLDSLSNKTDSIGGQVNNISEIAYNQNTKINVPTYFILLGSDLKQEITAPFHFHKKSWIKAGAIGVTMIGLGFADEPVQRFELHLRNNNPAIENVGKYVTKFGGIYEVYTLASLATFGFITKNQKLKTTTLLATQAYLTGAAMEYVLKYVTGRQRPSYIDPADNEPEPEFNGPFPRKSVNSSTTGLSSGFPSGHTTIAFAAATVFAMEYRDKPLVPIIAYSVAGLIGLSRITENRHWLTDVCAGAVLGYFTGRQVVNNYHRYAKINEARKKRGSLSFNMQYHFNQLAPGLIYTFR